MKFQANPNRKSTYPTDSIGWTLWNGATLLYSSNRNGVKTVEQALGGANLVVR